MNNILRFTLLCLLLFQIQLEAQNPSALYQNWVDAQVNGTTSILPTFSYAGYHNGEIGLPASFSQPVYNVTDYGAIANDGISDKSAIMATIAAAEANSNGGVVFFPPGRFVVNDGDVDDLSEVIRISKSNIVIKGSGSGIGGTELYQKDNTTHPDMATKDWVCPYLFVFWNGEDSANTYITDVTANADRETFSLQVADASSITLGQWVELYIKDTNPALLAEELSPYTTADLFEPQNLKIVNNGVEVREVHKVVSKSGNTITFKEPIHRAVDVSYNWKINNFKALEEVGIQDLKYTGGFIWNHIHHRAPQEPGQYPGEPVSGPHAYLSSSGWSGIQFNHVVNGWISNVAFSDMSQVAQFKFSANCTALNNTYTGNPGHNFIVTNSATGCFIGKNIDYTSGIWHGTGVNAVSIGNVLWRNESPQNGNSGMEVHASQPRTTLFDVCKGGFFFQQGGSTGALPNHLRHLVLWNFEGVSYQSTGVKSWRPNTETRYAKFLTPIISGLKGFTMSTDANQYQENESQGTHVDEESLYEHQLEYRLGSLPSWIDEEAPSPFYPLFHYEDFGAENRGYSVQVIENPDSQDEAQIGKRISDIPDAADTDNAFTEPRPAIRIPANQPRDQRALSIVGTSSNTNYELEAWVVMQPVDVSTNNPHISASDTYKYVSFWTEQRYANGGISALEAFVSTNYTNNVTTATWTNVTSSLNQIATSGQNPQIYIESVLDISAYTSSAFTLAFKYTSSPSAWSQTNRNGTFYISDVKYFVSSSALSNKSFQTENNIRIYPNPVSNTLNIKVANDAFKMESVSLLNVMGKAVYSSKNTETINMSNIAKGIYFLRLKQANTGNVITKKIILR